MVWEEGRMDLELKSQPRATKDFRLGEGFMPVVRSLETAHDWDSRLLFRRSWPPGRASPASSKPIGIEQQAIDVMALFIKSPGNPGFSEDNVLGV